MGRRLVLIALCAVALIGPAGGALAETAFAKFSPLALSKTADLAGPAPYVAQFGDPYAVLEQTETAIRLRFPDATEGWVRRTDVLLSADGLVVEGAKGYKTLERPRLWFWESHAALKAFLAGMTGISTDPSYEEVLLQRPGEAPAFPVLASDVVSVADQQAQNIALILLPVRKETHGALAKVSGSASNSFDIHFLVDVSGDALPFTQVALATIAQDLSRRLQDDPNDYRISVTYFGNNIRSGFQSETSLTWSSLGEKPKFGPDQSGRWQDPLLAGLAEAIPKPREGRRKSVLVILSGADILPQITDPRLGGAVTIDKLRPQLPEDLTILVAQVTPEPGNDLSRLAKTLEAFTTVEFHPYENGLGRTLVGRIQAVLGVNDDRRLEPSEMGAICETSIAADLICFLPFEATTADRLPPPTPGEDGADWYSTAAWVVVEGLNLSFNKIGDQQ